MARKIKVSLIAYEKGDRVLTPNGEATVLESEKVTESNLLHRRVKVAYDDPHHSDDVEDLEPALLILIEGDVKNVSRHKAAMIKADQDRMSLTRMLLKRYSRKDFKLFTEICVEDIDTGISYDSIESQIFHTNIEQVRRMFKWFDWPLEKLPLKVNKDCGYSHQGHVAKFRLMMGR